LDAASAVGFPEEITLLDDDGKPTEIIKLKKTGKDGMQGYLEWLSMNRIDVVGHSRPERGSSGFVHVGDSIAVRGQFNCTMNMPSTGRTTLP
jgi:hypothetical protein